MANQNLPQEGMPTAPPVTEQDNTETEHHIISFIGLRYTWTYMGLFVYQQLQTFAV